MCLTPCVATVFCIHSLPPPEGKKPTLDGRIEIYLIPLVLLRRGLDLYKGRSLNVLSHRLAREVMTTLEGSIASEDTNLIELLSIFMNNRYNSIFVLGQDNRLAGVVNFDDPRASARPLMARVISHPCPA